MRRASEELFSLDIPRKQKPLHNGSYEHGVPKIKNLTLFCTRDICVCYSGMFVCVNQHRNWPLRSTIPNAHGTNASPHGICTRTHTNQAFSSWFCCNSFRVDWGRRGNVCWEHQAKACSRSDQPVQKFKDGLGINMTMKTFFTLRTGWYFGTRTAVQAWTGVSAAWCPQRRSRLMPRRTHSSNLNVI